MTDSIITRLHISPLTPALLDSILAPSVRPLATDISFHTIPTFPENNYGFVSLPLMEADKLKKKLNGSILKGKKFKVDVARADPSKKKDKADGDVSGKEPSPKKLKKSSKRKAEDTVLDGYELPAERKVKRGWTEPASAKKFKKQNKADKEAAKKAKAQSKSKYTENAECLFQTKTPLNKTPDAAFKKNAKSKKSKAPNEVVVHEFSQTVSYPSFLKSTTGGKPVTAGFEEGKGWVDEDGNVQEIDSKKVRTADYHPGKRDGAKERAPEKKPLKSSKKSLSPVEKSESESEKEEEDSDWTSSSGPTDDETSSSESDTDSDNESEVSSSSDASSVSEKKAANTDTKSGQPTVKDKAVSGVDVESEAGGSEDSEDSDDNSEVDTENNLPVSSTAAEGTTETNEVHPLEALFKRARPDEDVSPETDNAFTFFTGNDDDIEDEEDSRPQPLEPLTPYSKQDRQIRGLRSGAPTPDTAVFPRHRMIESDEDEDMDDAEDDYARGQAPEATPSKAQLQGQQPEETDFAKWFWEHRGENNRAWKRRRREAAKDKRQRENRRKGLKGRG